MFRNSQSIYCKNELVAKQVREYAKKLNAETHASTSAPQVQQTTFASYPAELPKLPDFLTDIMNGGAFPAPEELTKVEQSILYDTQINTLVNLCRQTKNNDLAQHIRTRLDELGVDF